MEFAGRNISHLLKSKQENFRLSFLPFYCKKNEKCTDEKNESVCLKNLRKVLFIIQNVYLNFFFLLKLIFKRNQFYCVHVYKKNVGKSGFIFYQS